MKNDSTQNKGHFNINLSKKKAAKNKGASKKKAAKKFPAKKKSTKVIDEPAKTVYYKQGDLIDGFEILEEATKKKDPMPFDIQWELQKLKSRFIFSVRLRSIRKKSKPVIT